MGVYRLSKRAEMYEFGILKFGLLQAQKYFLEMHDAFQVLSKNADLGRDASEYMEDLKRFTFKARTMFYLQTTSEIFILRILSHRMDYERNL